MDNLRDLLKSKGAEVWTIDADKTVLDAIRMMAEKDVGSLVVVEAGKPAGILTERHYAREVFLKGRRSPTTPIREVMGTPVICASLEHTIPECMAMMTNKRIRHLPVVDQEQLVGIVSIGDLVKSQLQDQQFMIENLIEYIHGPSRPSGVE